MIVIIIITITIIIIIIIMGKQALNRHQIQKVNFRRRQGRERKNKKIRLVHRELMLTRGKNAIKGQVMMNHQSINMMSSSCR